MAFIKSAFIIVYMLMLVVLTIYSSIYYAEKLNVAWLGALLTLVPMLATFLYLAVFERKARTSASLTPLLVLAVIGVGLSTYKIFKETVDQSSSFVIAIIGLAMLLVYVFWYSKLDRKSSKLKFGAPLPAFTVEDEAGQAVPSTQFKGKSTIFMFYRGNWCPLCMAQVKEIADQYRKIEALGADVVLISPQPHEQTKKLSQKFDVPMRFLVDKDVKAAKTLGIFSDFGTPMGMQFMGYDSHTVMPTVIITDTEGAIIYLDETDNYRVRPEPGAFLKVLEEHARKTA